MTNHEKLARRYIMDCVLGDIGVTELNAITSVQQLPEGDIKITLEDGKKRILSITVTDSDE